MRSVFYVFYVQRVPYATLLTKSDNSKVVKCAFYKNFPFLVIISLKIVHKNPKSVFAEKPQLYHFLFSGGLYEKTVHLSPFSCLLLWHSYVCRLQKRRPCSAKQQ